MSHKLAIVGGTGAVGRVFIDYLNNHKLDLDEIKIVASKRSAGKIIKIENSEIKVEDIESFNFSSVDFAFFSAGSEVAKKYAPKAKKLGCTVIANSSCFRRDDNIPLIIPEVNGEILDKLPLPEIISNPNCSVSQLLIALKPIHDLYKVKRVDVATYQSVSGTGQDAIEELKLQSKKFLEQKKVEKKVYKSQIAFNVLPGAVRPKLDNGYTEEEMKMTWEAQKILDDSIKISSSCARVPVFYGHSEAVHVETEKDVNIEEMISKMNSFSGLKVVESNDSFNPNPLDDAEGDDAVFVGSIREDLWQKNRVNFWVISDNLRKGAALNSMQILERLISKIK